MLKTASIKFASQLSLDCVRRQTGEVVTRADAVFSFYLDEAQRSLWLQLDDGLQPMESLALALSQLLAPGPSLALGPLLLAPDDAKRDVALRLGLIRQDVLYRGRGIPGQPVTSDDLGLLQHSDKHTFYLGEIVAFRARRDDSVLWVYAQVNDMKKDDMGVQWLLLQISDGDAAATIREAAAAVNVFDGNNGDIGAQGLAGAGAAAAAAAAAPGPAAAAAAAGDGEEAALERTAAQQRFLDTIERLLREANMPSSVGLGDQIGANYALQHEIQEVSWMRGEREVEFAGGRGVCVCVCVCVCETSTRPRGGRGAEVAETE